LQYLGNCLGFEFLGLWQIFEHGYLVSMMWCTMGRKGDGNNRIDDTIGYEGRRGEKRGEEKGGKSRVKNRHQEATASDTKYTTPASVLRIV
jgi:hypothetical protein